MVAHQIVDVIAVGHGLMAAAGAVHVARLMAAAVVLGGAGSGVAGGNGDGVLVHVAVMRVVQMAAHQIVHMAVVADGRVAAAGAVGVLRAGVLFAKAFAHVVCSCKG